MRKIALILVAFLFGCVNLSNIKGPPSPPPPPAGTAAELTTGTETKTRVWSPSILATQFSGATAEVQNEAFSVANASGDLTHAPSQDSIHDWAVQIDTGLDGDIDALDSAMSESIADLTLTGANQLTLGVAGTTQGYIKMFSNVPANNFYFTLFGGTEFTENVGFRPPPAMPLGSNYLLNVDVTTGQMDYTVPGVAPTNAFILPADPAADTILGFDNTDNTYQNLTIGTGLSYDHASHTLSSTGGSFTGGTLTSELVIDETGIEGQPTDAITDCSSFAATGGGIFYDDSEGKWKKCQDNVLTDLDTAAASGLASTDIDTSAELRTIVTDESGTGALIFAGGAIGAATATTPATDDNDTSVATTAYVQGELIGGTWAAPSAAIGSGTPVAITGTTLSAGAGGFAVDADGDVTVKSVTATKVSGSASDLGLYEANSTDTHAAGFRGPASITGDGAYRGQLPNARASSANMVLAWTNAGETGTGTAADPYIQATSFVDLDGYQAAEATLTDIADGTITEDLVNTANPWADNEVADALTISGGTVNNSIIGGSTPAAGTFTVLIGNTSVQVPSSASLPGTCTTGQLYVDTDADTDGTLYICRATDTWKDIDDDGGAGGMATTDIDTSSELVTIVTDETGSATGTPLLVFNQNPSLNSATILDSGVLTFDESAADPNDSDIALSATDGVFKIASANGANNETLTIDLDGTANTATVGTDSGVTTVSLGALNMATTGTIRGAINIVTTTDGTESPTAAQMYGTMFIADHATATSDTDYTLPSAVAGMSACFYDNGAGTGGIIIDANTGDEILLYGTGIGAAEAIDSPGVAGDGANGDFICLVAIDATYWITMGGSGTWVDGGAD